LMVLAASRARVVISFLFILLISSSY